MIRWIKRKLEAIERAKRFTEIRKVRERARVNKYILGGHMVHDFVKGFNEASSKRQSRL